MMKKIQNAVPRYAIPWLVAVFVWNTAGYFLISRLADGTRYHDLSLPIDRAIPFVPAFIVVYILSYVFWVVNYALIARESREMCVRVLSGELIAKVLCFVIFLALPTTMTRADASGGGVFTALTRLIYMADEPNNLFPSIHCMDSYLCFRGLCSCRKVPKWYKVFSLVFAAAVFASVVFVKQHVFVDIPAGIVVAEAGLAAAALLTEQRMKTKRGKI